MYVHEYSGHHHAALALEKAFVQLNPRAECRLVDALRYTHPILEGFIRRAYLEIVQKRPEVWEYLYDNPAVVGYVRRFRRLVRESQSTKLKRLLNEFKPDAVVCTQAFPCGIVSDYKEAHGYRPPLYGVLTDYFPHSYWILGHVTRYFVPTEEAGELLRKNGVFRHRVSVTGIPVEASDAPKDGRPKNKTPVVLVMGGSQGIGPIEKIVTALDRLPENFTITVTAGRNEKLFGALRAFAASSRKPIRVLPYVEGAETLMREADILISKPGGLTITQALNAKLPTIFIDPIPGQEAKNASFLLAHRAALEARSASDTAVLTSQLLRSPAKAQIMKKNMAFLAKPDAALRIARSILKRGPLRT